MLTKKIVFEVSSYDFVKQEKILTIGRFEDYGIARNKAIHEAGKWCEGEAVIEKATLSLRTFCGDSDFGTIMKVKMFNCEI